MKHLIQKHQSGRGIYIQPSPELQEYINKQRGMSSDTIQQSINTERQRVSNQKRKLATKRALDKDKRKSNSQKIGQRVTIASTTNPDDVRVERVIGQANVPQLTERTENPDRRVTDDQLRQYYTNQELGRRFSQEVLPAAGNFMQMFAPSTWVGAAADKNRSFIGSMIEGNRGLGEINPELEHANLAFDIAAPFAWSKATKFAGEYAPKFMQLYNSPLTGRWTRFGNREYRLAPRANSGFTGIESRMLEPPPQEINIDTGEMIPGVSPSREGWEAVPINEVNDIVNRNLGRNLTTEEIGRIMGDDLDIFSIRDQSGIKLGLEGSAQDMAQARMRLNQYVDKSALRTRNLSTGERPYNLEDLVGDGKLKSNVVLDESKAGTHGRKNFFNEEDNAKTKASKYFNTMYSRPTRRDMEIILEENPYNRSGVLISTPDFHYSIDSFNVALKNLEKKSQTRKKIRLA